MSGSAADFHWPELIQIIARQYGEIYSLEQIEEMTWLQKRNYLARNPVTAARHIDYIFQQTWKKVILSGLHPIGQILNYDIRKEMQSRGTEHFHSALHVYNAPILDKDSDEEVIAFINKYITCEIPDKETDSILNELVLSRQTHHHTKTCTKKKDVECRFHFKKPLSDKTIIARKTEITTDKIIESKKLIRNVMDALDKSPLDISLAQLLENEEITSDQYHNTLQIALKRTTIILKRKPSEGSINPYNPYILKALRSNMDIQYIVDIWSCIAYITSYMCKPEKEMSQLMKFAVKEADSIKDQLKSIGNTFLHSREVSQHEAIARLIIIPLRESNTSVQYIPTGFEHERTRMLKPISQIKRMNDNDENIYMPNILDKYANRPDPIKNISLAEFVSDYTYNLHKQSRNHENEDSDEDCELNLNISTHSPGKVIKCKL